MTLLCCSVCPYPLCCTSASQPSVLWHAPRLYPQPSVLRLRVPNFGAVALCPGPLDRDLPINPGRVEVTPGSLGSSRR